MQLAEIFDILQYILDYWNLFSSLNRTDVMSHMRFAFKMYVVLQYIETTGWIAQNSPVIQQLISSQWSQLMIHDE